MNLFDRAYAGMSLTPLERAILRFLEGVAVATIISVSPAVSAALASESPDWGAVLHTALATFSMVVLMAAVKWAKAHGDGVSVGSPDGDAGDYPPGAPSLAALGLPDGSETHGDGQQAGVAVGDELDQAA
jgi:hypothetical protein